MSSIARGLNYNHLAAAMVLGLCVGMGTMTYSAPTAAQTAEVKRFDLPAGTLDDALKQFGRQSGAQLLVPPELVAGRQVKAINGEFTSSALLDRLLQGTGLSWERIPSGAVVIKAVSKPEAKTIEKARPQTLSGTSAEVTEMERITVTGTMLAGTTPVGAPLTTYDRQSIEQSGVATLDQFLRIMPQNFASTDAITARLSGGAADQGANSTYSATVNLHGVGVGATLVLVNGRRIAPTGTSGKVTDISMIPLVAVDRIEVLTDGASAIYGSDAVAGVVNFILRDDYEGAQTSLHYGDSSKGGGTEFTGSQLFGNSWEGGSALLMYSYQDQEELRASDRDFIHPAPIGTVMPHYTLHPTQRTRNLQLSAQQTLDSALELFADISHGRRYIGLNGDTATGTFRQEVESKQSNATLGATYSLSSGWSVAADVQYSNAKSFSPSQDTLPGYIGISDSSGDGSILNGDLRIQGGVWSLPAGEVRAVFGGSARRDEFSKETRIHSPVTQITSNDNHRNVRSLYGEVVLPIVGGRVSLPLIDKLDLSLAVRYDRYSDFGSTTNPRMGVSWWPTEGLKLRASWGTSFRAPYLNEIIPAPEYAYVFTAYDPQTSSSKSVLYRAATANDELRPEKAKTYTVGFDYTPRSAQGLDFSLSYFRLHFRDRISTPLARGGFFSVLSAPEVQGLIDRSPQVDEVQRLLDAASSAGLLVNLSPGDPYTAATLGAVYDGRIQNIARTRTAGFDFSAGQNFELFSGSARLTLDGTYLLESSSQATPSSPLIELVDTVYNPADLKLRTALSWSRAGFGAALAANYVDSYTDTRPSLMSRVNSWTTIDLQLSYAFDHGVLDGLRWSLSARNITDRDPPRLLAPAINNTGINFDASNASVLGRFISLQISKDW